MLNPGMILNNRYEIIELVGAGGMSEVYKAKCHVLNRFVAVKVLKPEFSSDVNFVTKFRIEAQSAAGLCHPNIVNVYDVAEDNGIYYIVMELVEGITLKDYIEQYGRIQPEQAIDFTIQIAQGLEVAHEHHTIHRDIKPQNIIVSNTGSLKVTDFGIARAASTNTMTSNAMGSVHYISPEQARGGYSDERSDIYSLGITLYEMLTGHVPYEGENNVSIALMHIQGEMISPREYYPDIPTSLEKVLMKCVQKKPERRYLTANALIADLRRVQANPNIDSIVVPPIVTNSPTIEMTTEEMEAIKNGKQLGEAPVDEYDDYGDDYADDYADDYDDKYNDYVDDSQPADQGSTQFDEIFDVDEDLDDDYGYYDDAEGADMEAEDYDGGEEIDPNLKKIIVISSIAIAVIIFICIFLIIGKIAGWNLFSKKEDTAIVTTEAVVTSDKEAMPNLTGLFKTAAEEEMKKAGFSNYKFESKTDPEVELDYVIETSVKAGELTAKDAEIIIYISSGKENTTVPDVINMEYQKAEDMIKQANLEVTHSYEFDDDVEKDHVISVDPEVGAEVQEGSTIKIIISNGKETKTVSVPDLVNKSQSEAESLLKKSNLKGDVSYDYSDTVKSGNVISQGTSSGSEVAEDTTISYVVSQGKKNKTYKASFSGKITDSGFDGYTDGNVTVTVNYTVGGKAYQIYSGSASSGSFPIDLSSCAALTGLTANSGSFSISVTDAFDDDVSQFFSTSGASASFTEE